MSSFSASNCGGRASRGAVVTCTWAAAPVANNKVAVATYFSIVVSPIVPITHEGASLIAASARDWRLAVALWWATAGSCPNRIILAAVLRAQDGKRPRGQAMVANGQVAQPAHLQRAPWGGAERRSVGVVRMRCNVTCAGKKPHQQVRAPGRAPSARAQLLRDWPTGERGRPSASQRWAAPNRWSTVPRGSLASGQVRGKSCLHR